MSAARRKVRAALLCALYAAGAWLLISDQCLLISDQFLRTIDVAAVLRQQNRYVGNYPQMTCQQVPGQAIHICDTFAGYWWDGDANIGLTLAPIMVEDSTLSIDGFNTTSPKPIKEAGKK